MNTFLVYVLVAVTFAKDIETKVAEVLAAYAKSLHVAEYDGQCPCVHAEVEAKAPKLVQVRVHMDNSQVSGNEAEKNQILFDRVVKTASAMQDAYRATIQELLDKAAPDPNCKDCGGSGTIRTTANPNGKWTRWEIGTSEPGLVLEGCLTDVPDDFNIVPVNMLNLAEALNGAVWAIITPDGQWHAAGESDWFGTSRIDDRDWLNTARKILEQHMDATLVVVECQS